ncbi:MAG: GTPase Era [Actinobacteria bacterium]|nr:GTPase Era [Acidimicrobiia bacterium]MCA1735070.1 GTPase Era [Actinomycetota bacterium]MDQ3500289.1 GTPase Era [Actinomycetota bacterium]
MRCGLVTLVGRPNVGKSTLVNRLVGRKITIASTRPQTTRSIVRGVVNDPADEWQIVLIDTPGLHKPRTELGSRLNRLVYGSLKDADVTCFLIDATQPIGSGDRLIAERVRAAGSPVVLAVTKVDRASSQDVLAQLTAATEWDFASYVPISSVTGVGIEPLQQELAARLPEGPALFPPDMDTDQPEEFLVQEIIREKFLDRLREELPHSLHVRLNDMEEENDLLRIEADVLVERNSQKGIVIGKGGLMLQEAGSEAREELEALLGSKVHLQLQVKVEPDWQRRAGSLDRLGFTK